jgi:hypothetical protein
VHSVLPSQEEVSQNDHLLSVPPLFNLETSGSRQSPRIAALNDTTQDGPAIVAYTSSTTQPHSQWIAIPKPKLSFLSVFTSVGTGWNFAILNPHSDNELLSFVAQIANDFEQINGLFDDMINEICHHIKACTASNKCFTYSQMLHEDDQIKFFEEMEVKIHDHKERSHWTLMLCKDLHVGVKTIMTSWSFKCKRFPYGMLNKHKA